MVLVTFVWFIIIFLVICSDVLALCVRWYYCDYTCVAMINQYLRDCNMEGIRVKISNDLLGSDFSTIKLKKMVKK